MTTPAGFSYRPEIDGLRCIAVASVLLFHAQVPWIAGGHLGVDVFFVISGYLITRLIWGELSAGDFSLLSFYERRARRLLPALVVVCSISTLAAWYILPPLALEEFGGHLAATGLFVANVVYWMQAGYFATKSEHLPLIHTWSLAIEEQFYLLFPLLLVAVARRGAKTTVCVLSSLLLLSIAVATMLSRTSANIDAAFYLLPSRAWELLVGALLALRERGTESDRMHLSDPMRSVLGAAGLAMIAISCLAFGRATPHPGLYTLFPVVGTCLAIVFATSSSAVGRMLAARPLVLVGLASYSIYLIHQPVLAFSRVWLARDLTALETTLDLLVATLFGFMFWRWVERPFRARGLVEARDIFRLAIASTIALCVGGALLIHWNGVPSRIDTRIAATLAQLQDGARARAVSIGLGKCHYNAELFPNLGKFLDEWDCLPRGSRPHILAIGESISADKSWLLREAGYAAGNIGGAGCPLVPPQNSEEICARLLEKVRLLFEARKIDGVVLAYNWLGAVPEAELEAIVSYWRRFAIPVLVFSGMPVYTDFKNRVARHIREGIRLEAIEYDANALAKHEQSLSYLLREGIAVVSSRDLLCGSGAVGCPPFRSGEPLMIDQTHLGPAGVRVMATRLRENRDWLDWLGKLR